MIVFPRPPLYNIHVNLLCLAWNQNLPMLLGMHHIHLNLLCLAYGPDDIQATCWRTCLRQLDLGATGYGAGNLFSGKQASRGMGKVLWRKKVS